MLYSTGLFIGTELPHRLAVLSVVGLVSRDEDPRLHHVTFGGMLERERQRLKMPHVVLLGEVGELLYVALTGHYYCRELPATNRDVRERYRDKLDLVLARLARAYIQQQFLVTQAWGWALAYMVVQAWGEKIRPWLGVVALDKEGRPVEDMGLYRWEVRL